LLTHLFFLRCTYEGLWLLPAQWSFLHMKSCWGRGADVDVYDLYDYMSNSKLGFQDLVIIVNYSMIQ